MRNEFTWNPCVQIYPFMKKNIIIDFFGGHLPVFNVIFVQYPANVGLFHDLISREVLCDRHIIHRKVLFYPGLNYNYALTEVYAEATVNVSG